MLFPVLVVISGKMLINSENVSLVLVNRKTKFPSWKPGQFNLKY